MHWFILVTMLTTTQIAGPPWYQVSERQFAVTPTDFVLETREQCELWMMEKIPLLDDFPITVAECRLKDAGEA